MKPVDMHIDELSGIVVDEAIAVHRLLGPGLLESVYETVLAANLEARSLKVVRQKTVPLTVGPHNFDAAFRVDIMVDDRLVVEVKAVEQLNKTHARQLLTYLRILQQPVGLLLNFSGMTMKEGIKRVVNNYRPQS